MRSNASHFNVPLTMRNKVTRLYPQTFENRRKPKRNRTGRGPSAYQQNALPLRQAGRAQEQCESRGGRPSTGVSNKPTVSVDVKQHFNQATKPAPGCCCSVVQRYTTSTETVWSDRDEKSKSTCSFTQILGSVVVVVAGLGLTSTATTDGLLGTGDGRLGRGGGGGRDGRGGGGGGESDSFQQLAPTLRLAKNGKDRFPPQDQEMSRCWECRQWQLI